jgi:hypothetical protein
VIIRSPVAAARSVRGNAELSSRAAVITNKVLIHLH